MVSPDKVLFPVKGLQDFVGFLPFALEYKITQNVDLVPLGDHAVPVFDEGLVHGLYILKRAVANTDNVIVAEMGVGGKIGHFSNSFWVISLFIPQAPF
jgi:hypothetical protein